VAGVANLPPTIHPGLPLAGRRIILSAMSTAPYFDVVLQPHRSLNRRGLAWILGLVGAVSLVVSIGFAAIGAWPVSGFFGLDVLLLCLAFRWSFASARDRECLRLTDDALIVRRETRGRAREWRFNPYWVRLLHETGHDGSDTLTLRSHGATLAIARFLSPPQRRDLAVALDAALRRHRAAP
jgi:uncharacterized membrane protein